MRVSKQTRNKTQKVYSTVDRKIKPNFAKYTDNNGQPDVDLNKYVAGMITKQAMKGLSEEDAEEIIDKVKADEDFSMEDDGDENLQQDMPQDNTQQQGQDIMPQMNESFKRFKKTDR